MVKLQTKKGISKSYSSDIKFEEEKIFRWKRISKRM